MSLLPIGALNAQQPASAPAAATEAPAQTAASSEISQTAHHRAIIDALSHGSFVVTSGSDAKVRASRTKPGETPLRATEADVVTAFETAPLSQADMAALWETLSDSSYAGLATLPIVKALVARTDTPRAREALWGGLNGNAKGAEGKLRGGARGLLGLFEGRRGVLLAALPPVVESEGAGDDMVDLMQNSQVFGGDVWDSLPVVLARTPAALARRIERDRERGRPAKWEYQAFEGMIRWKDEHLVAGAKNAPRSLSTLDALGETYVTMFNSLHGLDEWYRTQMLRGLGPVEVFNAAVGGERELYRLGTTSYRNFLHPTILKGIKSAGSLEAFLEQATPSRFGAQPAGTASGRGLIFLRIAASFGLLDSALATMRDRERFVSEALDALGNPRTFEASSTLVVDVLTSRSESPASTAFRNALLKRLYERYAAETAPLQRTVYGGMVAAYQVISGDRRDADAEREFPIAGVVSELPFERLFRLDAERGHIHRIFMRLDEDIDAQRTYETLGGLLAQYGATVQQQPTFVTYRIVRERRTIELYVNKPTAAGVRLGMAEIAKVLRGSGVETVIGRGHTGIITPLQKDALRVLGTRITDVAAVFVGACGGDASVRDMIATFGPVPFITTKSTGRLLINNALIVAYLDGLLALKPQKTLSLGAVLDTALARFQSPKSAVDIREDARLYQVNLATGVAMRMFDAHVRPHMGDASSLPVAAIAPARQESDAANATAAPSLTGSPALPADDAVPVRATAATPPATSARPSARRAVATQSVSAPPREAPISPRDFRIER